MKRLVVLMIIIFALLVSFSLVGCASESETSEPATETQAEPEEAPAESGGEEDPSRALVESKCSLCHTTERVWSADYDRATWEATVDRMKANGLVITDEEYEEVVTYLSEQ
jgi:cytochrome c5